MQNHIQSHTVQIPSTSQGPVCASDRATGQEFDAMQVAAIASGLVAGSTKRAADLIAHPATRPQQRTLIARIAATAMQSPLRVMPRDEHLALIGAACQPDAHGAVLEVFLDEVVEVVAAWSRFVPGPGWTVWNGGVGEDLRLVAPAWRHTGGPIVFDLIENADAEHLNEERCAEEVAGLFALGREAHADAFAGVRFIMTAAPARSRWFLTEMAWMPMHEVPFLDNGVAYVPAGGVW
jgi:hypothetical protein